MVVGLCQCDVVGVRVDVVVARNQQCPVLGDVVVVVVCIEGVGYCDIVRVVGCAVVQV